MTKQQLDNLKAIWSKIQQHSKEVYRIDYNGDFEDLDCLIDEINDTALELENFIGEFEEEVPWRIKMMTKYYRKKQIQPMTPYTPESDMEGVSISETDKQNGSPKIGDMIAYNPLNEKDRWLIAEKFFKDNYEDIVPNKGELK